MFPSRGNYSSLSLPSFILDANSHISENSLKPFFDFSKQLIVIINMYYPVKDQTLLPEHRFLYQLPGSCARADIRLHTSSCLMFCMTCAR